MDQYIINGGKELFGEVTISGAKNAAASILPGTLLVDGITRIHNVPDIQDVQLTLRILEALGATCRYIDRSVLEIDCRRLKSHEVPAQMGIQMRASHFFLGAMLARSGEAASPLPGGCDLGTRPIDQHLKGFEAMGASVFVQDDCVRVRMLEGKKLHGADIRFDLVTVGATMNLMLAAVLAEGVTVLRNAAKEPHIVDLAGFLNAMGADVSGAGTDTITIRGVKAMHGGEYSLIPDQIEAGTYMAAAAAAGGSVKICNVIPPHLSCITAVLKKMNVQVTEGSDFVQVTRNGRLKGTDIETAPYPGFPTDMQPQIGALLCLADGTSSIHEAVWADRFRYLEELKRMGASSEAEGQHALIHGKPGLHGAEMTACDLRAGAAMIIASLAAQGKSEIRNIQLIERGYQDITGKLSGLGADIHCERQ